MSEESLCDLWETIKRIKIRITEPQKEKTERRGWCLFEEIIAKNFSNLYTMHIFRIQCIETWCQPQEKNLKISQIHES